MHEYDLIAEWYASERRDTTGVPEAMALASTLKPGSRILDIGCGNGVPIARALLAAGHQVTGLDTSSEMLARFRVNCPDATAIKGSIVSHPLPASAFDAAIAWGVMFHLPPDDQIKTIANVAQTLKSGGAFLFTSGDADGLEAKSGTMNGVTFLYYSFSIENYRRILEEHGFTFKEVHQDDCQNTYYLAIRR